MEENSEGASLLSKDHLEGLIQEIKKIYSRSRRKQKKLISIITQVIEQINLEASEKNEIMKNAAERMDTLAIVFMDTLTLLLHLAVPVSDLGSICRIASDFGDVLMDFFQNLNTWCRNGQERTSFICLTSNFLTDLLNLIAEDADCWFYSIFANSSIIVIIGNLVTQDCNAEDRSVWSKCITRTMFRLAKKVVKGGDFCGQYGLTILIQQWMAWVDGAVSCNFLNTAFSELEPSMRKWFLNETRYDSDYLTRTFLNALNSSPRSLKLVTSLPCEYAFVGEDEIKPPEHKHLKDFWIDFCCGSKRIHMLCSVPGRGWVHVNIRVDQIDSVCISLIRKDTSKIQCNTQTQRSDTQMSNWTHESLIFLHIYLKDNFDNISKELHCYFGKEHRSLFLVFKEISSIECALNKMRIPIHSCGERSCGKPKSLSARIQQDASFSQANVMVKIEPPDTSVECEPVDTIDSGEETECNQSFEEEFRNQASSPVDVQSLPFSIIDEDVLKNERIEEVLETLGGFHPTDSNKLLDVTKSGRSSSWEGIGSPSPMTAQSCKDNPIPTSCKTKIKDALVKIPVKDGRQSQENVTTFCQEIHVIDSVINLQNDRPQAPYVQQQSSTSLSEISMMDPSGNNFMKVHDTDSVINLRKDRPQTPYIHQQPSPSLSEISIMDPSGSNFEKMQGLEPSPESPVLNKNSFRTSTPKPKKKSYIIDENEGWNTSLEDDIVSLDATADSFTFVNEETFIDSDLEDCILPATPAKVLRKKKIPSAFPVKKSTPYRKTVANSIKANEKLIKSPTSAKTDSIFAANSRIHDEICILPAKEITPKRKNCKGFVRGRSETDQVKIQPNCSFDKIKNGTLVTNIIETSSQMELAKDYIQNSKIRNRLLNTTHIIQTPGRSSSTHSNLYSEEEEVDENITGAEKERDLRLNETNISVGNDTDTTDIIETPGQPCSRASNKENEKTERDEIDRSFDSFPFSIIEDVSKNERIKKVLETPGGFYLIDSSEEMNATESDKNSFWEGERSPSSLNLSTMTAESFMEDPIPRSCRTKVRKILVRTPFKDNRQSQEHVPTFSQLRHNIDSVIHLQTERQQTSYVQLNSSPSRSEISEIGIIDPGDNSFEKVKEQSPIGNKYAIRSSTPTPKGYVDVIDQNEGWDITLEDEDDAVTPNAIADSFTFANAETFIDSDSEDRILLVTPAEVTRKNRIPSILPMNNSAPNRNTDARKPSPFTYENPFRSNIPYPKTNVDVIDENEGWDITLEDEDDAVTPNAIADSFTFANAETFIDSDSEDRILLVTPAEVTRKNRIPSILPMNNSAPNRNTDARKPSPFTYENPFRSSIPNPKTNVDVIDENEGWDITLEDDAVSHSATADSFTFANEEIFMDSDSDNCILPATPVKVARKKIPDNLSVKNLTPNKKPAATAIKMDLNRVQTSTRVSNDSIFSVNSDIHIYSDDVRKKSFPSTQTEKSTPNKNTAATSIKIDTNRVKTPSSARNDSIFAVNSDIQIYSDDELPVLLVKENTPKRKDAKGFVGGRPKKTREKKNNKPRSRTVPKALKSTIQNILPIKVINPVTKVMGRVPCYLKVNDKPALRERQEKDMLMDTELFVDPYDFERTYDFIKDKHQVKMKTYGKRKRSAESRGTVRSVKKKTDDHHSDDSIDILLEKLPSKPPGRKPRGKAVANKKNGETKKGTVRSVKKKINDENDYQPSDDSMDFHIEKLRSKKPRRKARKTVKRDCNMEENSLTKQPTKTQVGKSRKGKLASKKELSGDDTVTTKRTRLRPRKMKNVEPEIISNDKGCDALPTKLPDLLKDQTRSKPTDKSKESEFNDSETWPCTPPNPVTVSLSAIQTSWPPSMVDDKSSPSLEVEAKAHDVSNDDSDIWCRSPSPLFLKHSDVSRNKQSCSSSVNRDDPTMQERPKADMVTPNIFLNDSDSDDWCSGPNPLYCVETDSPDVCKTRSHQHSTNDDDIQEDFNENVSPKKSDAERTDGGSPSGYSMFARSLQFSPISIASCFSFAQDLRTSGSLHTSDSEAEFRNIVTMKNTLSNSKAKTCKLVNSEQEKLMINEVEAGEISKLSENKLLSPCQNEGSVATALNLDLDDTFDWDKLDI